MAREIKFRAWNPHDKEMFNPMPIVDFVVMKINAIVLMLGTGVNDKNNNEIFEGDIIISGNGTKTKIEFGNWQYYNPNVMHEDTFGIGFSFDGVEPFDKPCDKMQYEIIGNIYENPELLNK